MKALVLVLLAFLCSLPAQAGPLEDAKRAGQLGERPDGYVGLPKPSSEAQRLADEINAKRREAYGEIAKRNNAQPEAVGALTGARLIDQSPPGTWIMDSHGTWHRK
ncbi:MAG: YdbL family protein [Rhodospirillales bacterium]|nr:YdbL family protein [Rhodospirillales bacterium]